MNEQFCIYVLQLLLFKYNFIQHRFNIMDIILRDDYAINEGTILERILTHTLLVASRRKIKMNKGSIAYILLRNMPIVPDY